MTLKWWKAYYEKKLKQVEQRINEKGEDYKSVDYSYGLSAIECVVKEMMLIDGTVIYKDERGLCYMKNPDGSHYMNRLDGKTPYVDTHMMNYFYTSKLLELTKKYGVDDDEERAQEMFNQTGEIILP